MSPLIHAPLIPKARTAAVPFLSSPSLPTHSKCWGTFTELKDSWIKEWILSAQFLRKSHQCFTFALSDILILWNCWIKKCKRMKNRQCKFQKMVAWRWMRLNQSSCLLGPLAGEDSVNRVEGTVETLGFSEEAWKQMASGWIHERQQSSLQCGSAQQGQLQQAGCHWDREQERQVAPEKAEETRLKGGHEGSMYNCWQSTRQACTEPGC